MNIVFYLKITFWAYSNIKGETHCLLSPMGNDTIYFRIKLYNKQYLLNVTSIE